MWIGLTFLFVVGGAGFAYALWRVGRLLRAVEVDLHRTVDEVVPVIGKAGTSVDTINDQLGKVDLMLDSAVDMTESIDTAVRAVSIAVTEPIKKVSGTMAGMTEAVASFRDRMGDEVPEPENASDAGQKGDRA
jgi:hypothetical protein